MFVLFGVDLVPMSVDVCVHRKRDLYMHPLGIRSPQLRIHVHVHGILLWMVLDGDSSEPRHIWFALDAREFQPIGHEMLSLFCTAQTFHCKVIIVPNFCFK